MQAETRDPATTSAPAAAPADADRRLSLAWRALAAVEDPEIPALGIVDLGLIRFVTLESDGTLDVGLLSTYVGCPDTEVIRRSVEHALSKAGVHAVVVTQVLSPAWTRDWITPDGRRKLESYGIVPPERPTASM